MLPTILLLLGALLPTLVTWAYFVAPSAGAGGLVAVAYAIGKTVQFALPVVWWRLHRGQMHRRLGRFVYVMEGVLLAMVVSVGAWGVHRIVLMPAGIYDNVVEEIHTRLAPLGLDRFEAFVALATFYSVVHSLLEEIYWRWFVYGGLRSWLGVVAAAVVGSLAFAAHHVLVLGEYFGYASPLTWMLAGSVAIGGAYWCWLYQRSGSLIAPWLSHAIIDAAIFVVGYDLIR